MALDLSFQNREPRLKLPVGQDETPSSRLEGARTLFDVTKNLYEEKIKPIIDGLIEGPKERFGATKESIAQGSFAPLVESFQRQAEEINRQMSTMEGQINLTLGFVSGLQKVGGELPKKPIPQKKVPEKAPEPPVLQQPEKLLEESLALPKPTTEGLKLPPAPPKTLEGPPVLPPDEVLKPRQFIESVKESPQVSKSLKEAVEQLPKEQTQYGVISNKVALERAQARIESEGTDGALSFVLGAKEFSSDVSTTGIELMRRYQKEGNIDMATNVAAHLAQKATEGGQFIQAFSILNRLSPEGALTYATKRIGQKLSPDLADKITTQAKKIQELPYGYDKFKETQNLSDIIGRETPRSAGSVASDWFLELANLPRSLASSFFDFSFGLRQGLVAGYAFPKEWAGAFKAQFKPFGSERAYEELMDSVIKHPEFELAQKHGVGFTDVNLKLSGREERYMSSFAEKIPVLGIPVRATNRAYTAMANKLRMDTFSSLIKNIEKTGTKLNDNDYRSIAKLVNNITGRGELLKVFNSAKELLNAFFYSPRLMASRLSLLNPATYVKTTPAVRKEALRAMLSMAAGTTTILGLLSMIPGVKVGLDPRSADFGKARIGNTRIDIMGGFQQYIRIAAQLISGKYISSSTGKVITLGEGYNPLTKKDILLRGLESKEAPLFSFISSLLQGQDFEGNKIDVPKELVSKFVPMLLSDMYDLYKEDPELLPLGIPGIFGIGLQSYSPPEAYRKLNEINNASDPAGEYDKLKEQDPLLAEKVSRAKKEENFNELDWSLVNMGVTNGERAKFLVERFNAMKSDEEKAQLWDDLKEKKIISERVKDQIYLLLGK